MNIEVKDDMKNRVVDFLKSWKKTENWDAFNMQDYADWMEDAVDLLKEIAGDAYVEENN